MKNIHKVLLLLLFGGFMIGILSFNAIQQSPTAQIKFPYKQAGLTKEQAAAHLLNRFTYGPKPNEINEVVKRGLENWFLDQLAANHNDDSVNSMLQMYDALKMSNTEVLKNFPRRVDVTRMAVADGIIDKNELGDEEKLKNNPKIIAYFQQKGFRPPSDLYRQLTNQKILRAVYSNNQLQEVLTEFWFNHFNVSISKNQCAPFVANYERDAIRPYALTNFQDLLLATAKNPAMLLYLDNFISAGVNSNFPNAVKLNKRNQGLNENYAREVMELHTLGVEGGYTQKDVTEAARVLTGWTIYPISDYGPVNNMKKAIEKISPEIMAKRGFVHDGDFLFAMNRHDDSAKTVLNKHFAAGGGYEEGVELLKLLANHTSTAKFIAKKLAVRFVQDNPPATLVDKMATTFLQTKGNIKQVLLTMVQQPEFWSKTAVREKTKSPFELAMSALRILDATIASPAAVNAWITKMGQQMYYYQAPTGFPDNGEYWINSGALLNRMNFAMALATEKINGVSFNLAKLNNYREPESAEKALETYAQILLPQRNITYTVQKLKPLIYQHNLAGKISEAANNKSNSMVSTTNDESINVIAVKNDNSNNNNKQVLTQIVGVIIGSPEFQRR
jgi:uncharacterized protein (DUF1800 family)